MLKKPAKTVKRARVLRRDMSLPEVILWQELRKRPDGLRFRRQHPAGPFVLDFYCAEGRLCIEIDGEAHNRGDQPAFDVRRDAVLADHGIATLRIAARDVLANLDSAIIHIVATAHEHKHLPLHHSALPSGPPPQATLGEE